MISLIKNDVYNQLSKYPKRLFHVINVSLVAKSLAKVYDENLVDTYIAALFHDYAKYESIQFYLKYIKEEDIVKYQDIKVFYHSIAAANYLLKHYNINNNIYNAVYNHIFGRPKMSLLEKIIFVSDSVVLNGTNNTIELYKIALKDIDRAVLVALDLTRKSLEERNLVPYIKQIETYNYYERELNEKN